MGVKGLKDVKRLLQQGIKEFENDVKELVEITVGDIELEAIRNAPGPGDPIKTRFGSETQEQIRRQRNWSPISQSIGSRVEGFKGTVFVERSAGDVAAWVEFGTGQDAAAYLATVEPEWREEARKYYINGKGTIINQPYLYPAYIKHRTEFLKDLKQLVKKYSSK